jgi:general stress protein YciG
MTSEKKTPKMESSEIVHKCGRDARIQGPGKGDCKKDKERQAETGEKSGKWRG